MLRSPRAVVWRERKHYGSAAVACGSSSCPGNVGTVDPVLAASVPCVLPVPECLLPAVWGLLPDIHLQKCPVPLVFVLSQCVYRVWGLCGVRQPILALCFVQEPTSIFLLSSQALPGLAIWLCSRLYHPYPPAVSVGLERL